jgi:hypothetical protein
MEVKELRKRKNEEGVEGERKARFRRSSVSIGSRGGMKEGGIGKRKKRFLYITKTNFGTVRILLEHNKYVKPIY